LERRARSALVAAENQKSHIVRAARGGGWLGPARRAVDTLVDYNPHPSPSARLRGRVYIKKDTGAIFDARKNQIISSCEKKNVFQNQRVKI